MNRLRNQTDGQYILKATDPQSQNRIVGFVIFEMEEDVKPAINTENGVAEEPTYHDQSIPSHMNRGVLEDIIKVMETTRTEVMGTSNPYCCV